MSSLFFGVLFTRRSSQNNFMMRTMEDELEVFGTALLQTAFGWTEKKWRR